MDHADSKDITFSLRKKKFLWSFHNYLNNSPWI